MTAIGIDLGTSNTVVAHVKDGVPYTLVDPAGRRLIPSVISFHPSGTVLVGDSAKMRRYNDGINTVTGAKRLMGRPWGSPEVKEMQNRISYQLREGANQSVRAVLRNDAYSIPELSAFVLRKAKAWAEEALGETVTQAVITVPANFHELQRQATKLAGELAGLEVLRVLNEPTAAALAYGHFAPAAKDEQIAVYDFGGGTFDLTMLKMSERELRVRATAGDMFLGGDDIDSKIAEVMANAYLAKNYYDLRTDPEVYTRVRIAAERLKIALSSDDEANVPLNELMYGPGGKPINWSYTMTRRELDAILDPFIDQSLKVCSDALKLLHASPRDFDRVVLVGGTTLSARVRQRVTDFFGRPPVTGLDPEEAVALGAAISGTIPVARKAKAAQGAIGAVSAGVAGGVAGGVSNGDPSQVSANAPDAAEFPIGGRGGEDAVPGDDGVFERPPSIAPAASRAAVPGPGRAPTSGPTSGLASGARPAPSAPRSPARLVVWAALGIAVGLGAAYAYGRARASVAAPAREPASGPASGEAR